jgi:hypothetical protein
VIIFFATMSSLLLRGGTLKKELVYVASPERDQLIRRLNDWLRLQESNGTMTRLYDYWVRSQPRLLDKKSLAGVSYGTCSDGEWRPDAGRGQDPLQESMTIGTATPFDPNHSRIHGVRSLQNIPDATLTRLMSITS